MPRYVVIVSSTMAWHRIVYSLYTHYFIIRCTYVVIYLLCRGFVTRESLYLGRRISTDTEYAGCRHVERTVYCEEKKTHAYVYP